MDIIMKKKELFIYGNSGVGKELLYMIEKNNLDCWERISFINDFANDKECMGKPVFDFERSISNGIEDKDFIVAVGEPNKRHLLFNKIKEVGGNVTSILYDPKISDTTLIGKGTISQIGSIITTEVTVGVNCLINQNTIIGHNCKIGDHCVLSQRVCVGGFSNIGNNVYVGSGAVLRDRINIGNNCIIGMGAVVINDVADGDVVVGNPARVIRKNETGIIFK